jgi:hypothetical protein
VVIDWLLFALVPVLLLVGFVLAIRWGANSPLWLPLLSCVGLALSGLWSLLTIAPLAADGGGVYYVLGLAWGLVSVVLLIVATLAVWRQWSSRAGLLILGMGLPAPLLVSMLAVAFT